MGKSWQDEQKENLEKFTNWVRYHRGHYEDFRDGYVHDMLENKDYLQWIHNHPEFDGLDELEQMVQENVDPIVRKREEARRELEDIKKEMREIDEELDEHNSLAKDASECHETISELNTEIRRAFSEVFIEFFSRFHPEGEKTDFDTQPVF